MNIALLGSTGSVGKNALKVIDSFADLKVTVLAAKQNATLLYEQAVRYRPKMVVIYDEKKRKDLAKALPFTQVVSGLDGLMESVRLSDVDAAVFALSGSKAVGPCLAALEEGKRILLANKEILVSAGSLIMQACERKNGLILPIDSEHAAIHQCLRSGKKSELKKIILTASGGPFFRYSKEELSAVTIAQALKHPKWSMGSKITIDSSTLMNKGLEIIEAMHLFSLKPEEISVVVHPESIVHSFVEYRDGNLIAQLAEPDMKIPLQYALTYPERREIKKSSFSFVENPSLTFYAPDRKAFPCLALAEKALREKSSFSCALNAANETLVERFLQEKISWKEIGEKLEEILSLHQSRDLLSLYDVRQVDLEARSKALEV